MDKLAIKLKTLRLEKGITQKELAQYAGLSSTNISTWELGKSLPLPDGLISLANYFGCSIDYLLGRETKDGIINFEKSPKSEIEKLYEQLNRQNQIMAIGYLTALLHKQLNG